MNGFLPNKTAHAAGLRISHNNPNVFFRDHSFIEDTDVSYSSHDITREHVQTNSSREHVQTNTSREHAQSNSSREHVQTNAFTGHAQSYSFTEHAQNHTETSSGGLMQTPHPPPRTGRPNLQDLRDLQAGNNNALNHLNQNDIRKQGIVRGRVVTKDMRNSKERNGQVNTGLGSGAKRHQENYQQIGKSQFLFHFGVTSWILYLF